MISFICQILTINKYKGCIQALRAILFWKLYLMFDLIGGQYWRVAFRAISPLLLDEINLLSR